MMRDDQEVCRYCDGEGHVVLPQSKTLTFSPDPLPEVKLEPHYVTCWACGGTKVRLKGVERCGK